MLKVHFVREGLHLPDHEIEDFLETVHDGDEVYVSNQLILLGIQAKLKEGFYGENVQLFVYEDGKLKSDETGKLTEELSVSSMDTYLDKLIGLD